MKDSISQASPAASTEGFSATVPRDSTTTDERREESSRKELQEIKDVVTRYVGQLLQGCKDPSCSETLCDTGRRNTSARPVRTYTPRSARAIALAIVSGPKPRSRLCPRYTSTSVSSLSTIPEGARDSSSFIQHFADTPSIRNLVGEAAVSTSTRRSSPSTNGTPQSEAFDIALKYCRAFEDRKSKRSSAHVNDMPEDIFSENEEMSKHWCVCLKWVLDGLPRGDVMQWRQVNRLMGAGCAYPQYNRDIPRGSWYNTWLDILDAVDHGPGIDVLRLLMRLLSRRYAMEQKSIGSLPHVENGHKRLINRVVTNFMHGKKNLSEVLTLIVLIKRYFLHYWEGEVQLGPNPRYMALRFLGSIHGEAVRTGMNMDMEEELFPTPNIAQRLDVVEVARTWIEGHHRGHLLFYGGTFTVKQLATYFRTMNHLRMQKANSDAAIVEAIRVKLPNHHTRLDDELHFLEERYLLLNVSRDNLLQDTFDQLWQRRSGELLRPLRVRLGELDRFEIGHDLGGVQVEFFNLVCKELLAESNQMFTTDSNTRYNYFRPGSLQPLYMFELCGLLFALAVYNGISLPVNFPKAFYYHLFNRGFDVDELLDDGWPDIKKSLDHIKHENILGVDNTLTLEANGVRLTVAQDSAHNFDELWRAHLPVVSATPIVHHADPTHPRQGDPADGSGSSKETVAIDIDSIADAWPGWLIFKSTKEPEELTDETKSEWVIDYTMWLTLGSVLPQFRAFQKGIKRIFEDLNNIPSQHLKTIFEGTTHLDISELQRVTTYDGFEPTSRYVRDFWSLVREWPEEKQKQLLKFVTACERIPAGGASGLTFRIQRATHMSTDHLPTSSTCFGTLTMPKYESVKILDRKLSQALKFGAEGFGSG